MLQYFAVQYFLMHNLYGSYYRYCHSVFQFLLNLAFLIKLKSLLDLIAEMKIYIKKKTQNYIKKSNVQTRLFSFKYVNIFSSKFPIAIHVKLFSSQ